MTGRGVLMRVLGTVMLIGLLAVPVTAHGDDHDSGEVLVTVDIAALDAGASDCAAGCADALAQAGGDAETLIVWIILLLVAGGTLVVWGRRSRRADRVERFASSRAYDTR